MFPAFQAQRCAKNRLLSSGILSISGFSTTLKPLLCAKTVNCFYVPFICRSIWNLCVFPLFVCSFLELKSIFSMHEYGHYSSPFSFQLCLFILVLSIMPLVLSFPLSKIFGGNKSVILRYHSIDCSTNTDYS